MTVPDTWPRHMRKIDRYGRLAVGQRVRWERSVYAPTNDVPTNPKTGWLLHPKVELSTECVIQEIRTTETGVACVLRLDCGALQVTWGVDAYGHAWGGCWPRLTVLVDSPEQRTLLRGSGLAVAHTKPRRVKFLDRPALMPPTQAGLFVDEPSKLARAAA
jgi:hypothetical protein